MQIFWERFQIFASYKWKYEYKKKLPILKIL
jgi:hypothetical protein